MKAQNMKGGDENVFDLVFWWKKMEKLVKGSQYEVEDGYANIIIIPIQWLKAYQFGISHIEHLTCFY